MLGGGVRPRTPPPPALPPPLTRSSRLVGTYRPRPETNQIALLRRASRGDPRADRIRRQSSAAARRLMVKPTTESTNAAGWKRQDTFGKSPTAATMAKAALAITAVAMAAWRPRRTLG